MNENKVLTEQEIKEFRQKQLQEIFKALEDINCLSTTQYDSDTVLQFARIILQSHPETKPEQIKLLMSLFIKEIEDFNPHKGVRNFTGYLSRKKAEQDRKKISTYGPFEF